MKKKKMIKADATDLSSFATEKEMEDIVSDSHYIKKNGRHYKKKPSKFRRWWKGLNRWKRVAIVTSISVVLTAALLFGVAWGVLKSIYTKNVYDKGFDADQVDAVGIIDKDIVNIALFGIDTRQISKDSKSDAAFKGLSDSIMIMSLNTKTKTVKIISVMRDSLVPIYRGKNPTYTKINAAYSYGGPELAVKTLNQIFKLDIRDYATVNFAGMAEIIDAIGGIDVTLVKGELDVYGYESGRKMNWGLNGLISEQCALLGKDPSKLYIKSAGTHHLNGIQAVAYARIRHAANAEGTNNDYGRTDRQRYVMEQLFNKAVKAGKSQYVKLANAMLPCCKTSLEFEEVVSLATNVLTASPTFEQTRVPLMDYQMPGRIYVYYDLDYAGKLIHAFIYDNITPEDYMKTNGIEKNDWYGKLGKNINSGKSKKPSTSKDSSGITIEEEEEEIEIIESPDSKKEPDTSSAPQPGNLNGDEPDTDTSDTPNKQGEENDSSGAQGTANEQQGDQPPIDGQGGNQQGSGTSPQTTEPQE